MFTLSFDVNMEQRETTVIAFRAEDELIEKLDTLRKQEKRSRSNMILKLILEALKIRKKANKK